MPVPLCRERLIGGLKTSGRVSAGSYRICPGHESGHNAYNDDDNDDDHNYNHGFDIMIIFMIIYS